MDQDDRTAGLTDVATVMRNGKRQAKQAKVFFNAFYNQLNSMPTDELVLITSVNDNQANGVIGPYEKELMDTLIADRLTLMTELQIIIDAFNSLTLDKF